MLNIPHIKFISFFIAPLLTVEFNEPLLISNKQEQLLITLLPMVFPKFFATAWLFKRQRLALFDIRIHLRLNDANDAARKAASRQTQNKTSFHHSIY